MVIWDERRKPPARECRIEGNWKDKRLSNLKKFILYKSESEYGELARLTRKRVKTYMVFEMNDSCYIFCKANLLEG